MSSEKMRWYVVHAYSGYEKRVQAGLLEAIERHGVEDLFGDILEPTEEVVEIRDGRSVSLTVSSTQVMCLLTW